MRGTLKVYLFGTQSEPVLQSIRSEAHTIRDQEAGGVGVFGARGQRDNAQAPAHCVVAHLHQLL